jgi:hypothetical protein
MHARRSTHARTHVGARTHARRSAHARTHVGARTHARGSTHARTHARGSTHARTHARTWEHARTHVGDSRLQTHGLDGPTDCDLQNRCCDAISVIEISHTITVMVVDMVLR